MAHKIIQLTESYPDTYVDELVHQNIPASDEDYDPQLLITGYCTVLKPNGEVLLKVLPRALDLAYTTVAFNELESVPLHNSKSSLRGAITSSLNKGKEGVFGFMDGSHRFNFCRATSLTAEHLTQFQASLPFIRSAAELMKEHLPDRYAAQMAACKACHPDYIIPGTCFSTVTLNLNTTATYHTDKGDYKPGIGVIAATWARLVGKNWKVVTENPAKGGILVFPKYRVAVKVRSQDIVLCDVHEVHGVTPIAGEPEAWARMSFVMYLREKMSQCTSLVDEVARVSREDTAKYKAEGKDIPAAGDDWEDAA